MRNRLTALLAVLALGLIAACGTAHEGGDDESGGTTDPDSTATMPTEIPSWLLECGADKGDRDETLQLADLDLTQATWSMPGGYAEASGYVEDNPVEELYSIWVAEPTSPTLPRLNVINVVIYTGIDWGDLADDCGRVPLEAVEEKLAQYREQIGASPLSDAQMTEVAGHPAIQQEIGLSSYDYTGYWLFSEDQLLHVYCQWTGASYESAIRSGCDTLVGSVQVPDA